VDQKAVPVGAPSGARPTVPVRLKPHLPRIFEITPQQLNGLTAQQLKTGCRLLDVRSFPTSDL